MQNVVLATKRFLLFGSRWPAIVALLLTSWACGNRYSGPVASLSMGMTTNEVNLLILIAQDQGYFAANGLDVAQEVYPSGVAAIDGVFNDEVDMAAGSEYAFVGRVLSQADIRTIAAINRSSIEYLVGRVDRGISSLADLKGKTVGVPLESRPEFALHRFLYFRGIDVSDVTLVNVPVNQSVEALVSGQVDAVAAWQPYIDQIREQMDGRVVTWSVQEDQPSYTLVMCKGGWTVENREIVTRFLRSLVDAERYVAQSPEAARAFLQEHWGYSEAYVASVWPDLSFSVLLDQALVVAMEDQARWMIDTNLTNEKRTPNFLKYIDFDGLEAVKPEAVDIIR